MSVSGSRTARRSVVAAGAALLCSALGLSACDGGAPAARTGPVEIEFWYEPNGPHPGVAVAREAELFERAHPGVRVRLTQLPWEEALTRMTTAAAGGRGPDVLQVGSTWVAGLAAQGAFSPLTDADLAAVGGEAAFLASAWSPTVPLGADRPVVVPWFLDTRVVYHRTDVLRAAGLDPAAAFSTVEAFEATLARLLEVTGERPFGFPGVSDWNVVHNAMPWVACFGGRVLDERGRAVHDERTTEGVYQLQRLVGTYGQLDVLEGDDDDATAGFARGDYPVVVGGPYLAPVLADEGTDPVVAANWSTAELPAGPAGRVGFLGGSDLAISAGTRHRAEAVRWLQWLTSPDSQRRTTTADGMLPSVRAAAGSGDARTAAFAPAAAHGRAYAAVPQWTDVEAQLQHDLSDLWRAVLEAGGPLSHRDVVARVEAAVERVGALTPR